MNYVKLFEEFDPEETNEKWYHNAVMGVAATLGSFGSPSNSFANSNNDPPVKTETRAKSTEKNAAIDLAMTIQKTHTGDNLLCFDFVYKIISGLTRTNNKTLRKDMSVQLNSSGDMKLLQAIENGHPATRGVQYAVEKAGLGNAVDKKDAKAGDMVQFWNRTLTLTHMYDAVQRAKDEKAGKPVTEKVYVYRSASDQYYLRKDIKTPEYKSITMDAAKQLARQKSVELVDFDIWGHCAMVTSVGSDGTIYLAGSGHEKGFSGTLFGIDSAYNKIVPGDHHLANAYFVRLDAPITNTLATR